MEKNEYDTYDMACGRDPAGLFLPEKPASNGGVVIEGGDKHHEDSTYLGKEQPDTGRGSGIFGNREEQTARIVR